MDTYSIKQIGIVRSCFPEKFGIPRQAGLVETEGRIEFYPPYNDRNAFKGLEDCSHIWVLWLFSESDDEWRPMVRPPRLGGNTKVGVFASRSPFRPNSIGMSCVELKSIEMTDKGPVLVVSGLDMLDGTPVIDIKPYNRAGDCRPEAACGFTDSIEDDTIEVVVTEGVAESSGISEEDLQIIKELIAKNPRPRYQDDGRKYGMKYKNLNIRFKVERDKAMIDEITDEEVIVANEAYDEYVQNGEKSRPISELWKELDL